MPKSILPNQSRQRGQGLLEYALILAMVSLAIIAILALVGPTVSNVFSNVVYQINYGSATGGVGWRGGDDSSYVPPAGVESVCGDGWCDFRSENYDNCPADCSAPGGGGRCGDGNCEPAQGENSITCPLDCSGGGLGICGDGICNPAIGENATNCYADCGGTAPTPTPGGPTPIPDCNELSIGAVQLTTDQARVSITNGLGQPITISRIVHNWAQNGARLMDYMWLGSSSNHIWGRANTTPDDTTAPTDTGGADAAGWLVTGGSPTILAGITVDLVSNFRNGPSITSGEASAFNYTVSFTNGCVISNLSAPATMTPDTGGTPDCSPFQISAVTLNGANQARATITNNSAQPVAIVGLIFTWPKLSSTMVNDWIQLERPDGTTGNYIWSGSEGVKDDTPPTDSMVADVGQWLVVGGASPTLAASDSQALFNEFDSAPDIRLQSYPSQYSYHVFLSNGCELETDTPLPAYTYINLEESDFTVTGSFNGANDIGASRCYMYWANSECRSSPTCSDIMTYNFNVTDPGTYVIWAHVRGNLMNSGSPTSYDSFWVQVDDGTVYSSGATNGYLNFNGLPTSWSWVRVRHGEDPSTQTFLNLTAGQHTLRIREREIDTGIDAFVITNDLAYTPPPAECAAANPQIMEAEDARITGTMMQTTYDSTYSGCNYVGSADSGGTYDGQGTIEFDFNAPITADYVIWSRAIGENGSSDSFYVSVDGGYEYLYALHTTMPSTPYWARVRHNNWEDSTYPSMDPVIFNLTAGQHTIRFRTREDGSKLDAIVVALRGGYTPPSEVTCADVSTPTPQPMLTCGSTVTDNITNANWYDNWQFIGNENTLVTLTMRRTSGNLDAWLDLYNPTDGSILVSDDDHGAIPGDSTTNQDAQLAYVLPGTGLYTLRATRYQLQSGSTIGGYNLEMQCRPLTPQPIACGDEFQDSIEEEDWLDLWSFGGQEGAQVTIAMDSASGSSLNEYLILLDPDGNTVAEDNDAGPGDNALIANFTLPESGIYTIIATRSGQAWGTTRGDYRLRLACQMTSGLACGKTQRGRITNADYYDYWEFTADAGTYISVTMYPDPSTPDLDPYLELYRSSDLTTALISDDDDGNGDAAAFSYLITQSGSYTVRARRYGSSGGADGTTQGEYQVSLTCHTPQPITCEEVATGTLDNTDYYDIYTITVPTGVSNLFLDIGQFPTSGTLAGGNGVRATLYQNSLPPHDNSDDTNRVYGDIDDGVNWLFINRSVTAGTTYYIRAGRQGEGNRSSDTGITGEYALSVRCGWYVPPENTVACNTPVHGEITDHNWYDYYTFNATAGQLLSVTMYKDDAALNPSLNLYGPTGAQVTPVEWGQDEDHGDGNNAALRHYLVPANGTYTIRATRYNTSDRNQAEGRYTLNVACNTPQTIACGETVTGAITNQDFIDRYTFTGQNNGRVQIQMTTMTGDLDSKIYLLRPGYAHSTYDFFDHQPQSSDATQNATLNATLDRTTNPWEIWASRYSASGRDEPSDAATTGTYSLTLNCDWSWTPQMCATNLSIAAPEWNPIDPANSVRARVANTGPFDVQLDRVQFFWPQLLPGTMYNDYLRFGLLGYDIWGADGSGASADLTPPTDTFTDSPYMTTDLNARRLTTGTTTYIFNDFDSNPDIRGGSSISQYRFVLTFSNGCTLDTSVTPVTCGNGTCQTGEDPLNCPADCPAQCGDGLCTGGENAQTCASDCPAVCGDGLCTGSESQYTCSNDCPPVTTSIACGGTANQNITNVEWYDWYRFNAIAGQRVTIRMTRTSDNLDAWLDLYASDMTTRLTYDDDSAGNQNALINNYALPGAGTYYIRATRYQQQSGSTYGAYTLTLECVACGDGWCNGGETNATCPSDCPVLCGDARCEGSETLATCPQDCAVCGDGTCTAVAGETAYTCPTWAPPTNGDCPATATPIACDSTTNGDITNAEWFDMYSFTASAGQHVTITMLRTSGDLDSYLQLYNASGTLLTSDDDSGGNQNAYINDFALATAGTYYIRATRYDFNYPSATTQGNYSLILDCSIACASFEISADYFSGRSVRADITNNSTFDMWITGITFNWAWNPGVPVGTNQYFDLIRLRNGSTSLNPFWGWASNINTPGTTSLTAGLGSGLHPDTDGLNRRYIPAGQMRTVTAVFSPSSLPNLSTWANTNQFDFIVTITTGRDTPYDGTNGCILDAP